jgi:hypothetical protein
MAAIYSNGGNRWNILGFNFNKRDALSSVYKISMGLLYVYPLTSRTLLENVQQSQQHRCQEIFNKISSQEILLHPARNFCHLLHVF